MSRYNQGVFTPKNPQKYVGTLPIVYRSAWELTFMNFCDNQPSVLQWASESIEIGYQNPLTGRWHRYIPDFLITYVKDGKKYSELIEIKPLKQTLAEEAKTKKDKIALVINQAKWAAAMKWCKMNGLKFRVLTEHQLYSTARNRK